MHLTRYTDYSLRMLIHLALEPTRLVTITDVATRNRISRNHLMKVAHRLGTQHYIETVRGKGGGLRLARPPTQIRLGAVVRDMEHHFPLVDCFEPGGECWLDPACLLKKMLGRALDQFMGELDRYTLQDLVAHPAGLQRLLGLPARRARKNSNSRTRKAG